ncbi:protein-S-isoprenylcysteine O-methyltransferase-like [Lineus longissimus]|uniref:protein-S-isoprenylcysteine O-methyltransferase-like n=1 Tax=Lineus longissimus TaxID=88925 RepID=UPI00315C905D
MTFTENAKDSLRSFLIGCGVVSIYVFCSVPSIGEIPSLEYFVISFLAYAIVINVAFLFLYQYGTTRFQVAWRGGMLGIFFGLGSLISCSPQPFCQFGWYLVTLSFFHWSEYFSTAVTNPRHTSLDSYLLNHSAAYQIAAVASWLEYLIEWYLLPGLKHYSFISITGLIMVVLGEALRKGAMFTAGTNFNHYVQHVKEEGHVLVTGGVYSYFRHPSYVGWFYWSIGTQLILCNPFCLAAYTIASWKFFKDRIDHEEITLLNFFGEQYLDYQKKVGTGLPFIKGYRIEI